MAVSNSDTGQEFYRGIYFPVRTADGNTFEFSVSISDVIRPHLPHLTFNAAGFVIEAAAGGGSLPVSVTFTQGNDSLIHPFKAFRGGVGKRMLRHLYENSTNIFDCKLLDYSQQFFLTTRTFGRHLSIRESEIGPVYFFMTGSAITVISEYGRILVIPSPSGAAADDPYLCALHLDRIRKVFLLDYGELPAFLGIMTGGDFVFDITFTPAARTPNKYIIEFLNSFGVPDRMEITGKCVAKPEFSNDGTYDRFDDLVDDFIEQNERVNMREVIAAEFGYKTPEEFLFARDMFISGKRYLIDASGNRFEIRILSDSFSHELHPVHPGSIPFEIRFVDANSVFSPERDDSPPEFNFGAPIWEDGLTNGYGFLFSESLLNSVAN
jgi:hypothetical protein